MSASKLGGFYSFRILSWDQIAGFDGHLDRRTTQRYIHFMPKDNLDHDPGEMTNLAESPRFRDELSRCRRLLLHWLEQRHDTMGLSYVIKPDPDAIPASQPPKARGTVEAIPPDRENP